MFVISIDQCIFKYTMYIPYIVIKIFWHVVWSIKIDVFGVTCCLHFRVEKMSSALKMETPGYSETMLLADRTCVGLSVTSLNVGL